MSQQLITNSNEENSKPKKKCETCDKDLSQPKTCGICRTVSYCSRECQVKDWKEFHKKVCKFDKLLHELSKDEKTGFMNLSSFSDVFINSGMRGTPQLPPVCNFLNPLRYYSNHRDSNDTDKLSPCQEVYSLLDYLSCVSHIRNNGYKNTWQTHFNITTSMNLEEPEKEIKKFLDDKINKSKFCVLLGMHTTSMEMYEWAKDNQSKCHYWSIFKIENKYKLVHSFGRRMKLSEQLNRKSGKWITKDEIKIIINAFLSLEKFKNVEESGMIVTGFKWKLKTNYKKLKNKKEKRNEYADLTVGGMYNLTMKDFLNCGEHVLNYMDYQIKQFKGDRKQVNYYALNEHRVPYQIV